MKLIISFVIITVIISVVSSFSISKTMKNVNKAASVAVVSSLIAVSPALADTVFAAPISKLVLADVPGFSTTYSKGTYLIYDCPGNKAYSLVSITKFAPQKVLTGPIVCSTDKVGVIPSDITPLTITFDATKYGSKFFVNYVLAGQTVVVSAQKAFVK